MKVTILAPKRAKPFGTAPPTLILDPVFPIRINSHVVLFIDVYLLKYSYLETRSRCVNTSFIIQCRFDNCTMIALTELLGDSPLKNNIVNKLYIILINDLTIFIGNFLILTNVFLEVCMLHGYMGTRPRKEGGTHHTGVGRSSSI